MLRIAVLDSSAESRSHLVNKLSDYFAADTPGLELLPRVNIQPYSPNELKFNAAPDLCVIGPNFVNSSFADIAGVKRLLPKTPLLVVTPTDFSGLIVIEQLARVGVDDTITEDTSAAEFLRKLVLLIRRAGKSSSSNLLLVDGGKGGVGVTSIVAGLGEMLYESGKKIVLIDMDFQTQDLSRFLGVRPFINENLQLLFDLERPVTEEYVEQALYPVWQGDENFRLMPPIVESDELFDSCSPYSRVLLSILEVLDANYDHVIVDIGHTRGALLRTLYRVADSSLMIVNNDPAALYASVDKAAAIRRMQSPNASMHVLENASNRGDLSPGLLKQEFIRTTKIDEDSWCSTAIPFCQLAHRWPGSGSTPFSLGKRTLVKSFRNINSELHGEASTELNNAVSIEEESSTLVSRSKGRKYFNFARFKRSKQLQLPEISGELSTEEESDGFVSPLSRSELQVHEAMSKASTLVSGVSIS